MGGGDQKWGGRRLCLYPEGEMCLGLGEVVVEMIVSGRIHDTLLRGELLVWIY